MHISIQFKQIILTGFLTSTLLQASALEDGNNAAQKGHMKTALKHWEKKDKRSQTISYNFYHMASRGNMLTPASLWVEFTETAKV